jgi:hypothetical protein
VNFLYYKSFIIDAYNILILVGIVYQHLIHWTIGPFKIINICKLTTRYSSVCREICREKWSAEVQKKSGKIRGKRHSSLPPNFAATLPWTFPQNFHKIPWVLPQIYREFTMKFTANFTANLPWVLPRIYRTFHHKFYREFTANVPRVLLRIYREFITILPRVFSRV